MVPKIPFVKYQALGNDYLLIEPEALPILLTADLVRFICNRHYGVGSDGLLLGPLQGQSGAFSLEIYNPDGSQAEKSGNGLRIFARYLWDTGRVGESPFTVDTVGGVVRCQVFPPGNTSRIEMGMARDLSSGQFELDNQLFTYYSLSIGNPHCVVIGAHASAEQTRRLGPLMENDPRFPQRTNVQFVQYVDRRNINIEIWERGAGYTLTSGSSSCAAAYVAWHLGQVDSPVKVHMPGGILQVDITPGGFLTLTGPVTRVLDGCICLEGFSPA